MSKKLLSERDICTKSISHAFENTGWSKLTQYLEEVPFLDGTKYLANPNTTLDKINVAISSILKVNFVII